MLLHWQLDHEHLPPRPAPNWLPFSYSEYLICCPPDFPSHFSSFVHYDFIGLSSYFSYNSHCFKPHGSGSVGSGRLYTPIRMNLNIGIRPV